MKELVKKVKSFIVFDFPVRFAFICEQFTNIHSRYQEHFPNWNLAATRKKVIAHFWFRQVLLHYSMILLVAITLVLPYGMNSFSLLLAAFVGGSISFVTLTIFNYWPTYYSNFLPKLDIIMAEQEKLIIAQEETKKCKRTQLSIPSLTIIYYAFSKIGNIPLLPSNDKSAELLNNLFGSDKDKLKQNLSRLYKLSQLSPKERAEICKGIDAARAFFEALDYPPAQKILDQLDLKLQKY